MTPESRLRFAQIWRVQSLIVGGLAATVDLFLDASSRLHSVLGSLVLFSVAAWAVSVAYIYGRKDAR